MINVHDEMEVEMAVVGKVGMDGIGKILVELMDAGAVH